MNEVEKLRKIKKMADAAAEKIAQSMASMFGLDVEMKGSSVNMISVDSIYRLIRVAEDDVLAGSYISFTGFLSGSALCVLSIKSANSIANILLSGIEREANVYPFTEMQKSAIVEFTNIVISSFIDVWANTLSVEVDQRPPALDCDRLSSLIEVSLKEVSEAGDFSFLFDSMLSVTDHNIDIEVLVIPEMDSLQKVFDNLKPVPRSQL